MKGYELYEADRLVRKTLPAISAGEGIYVIMRFSDLKQGMLKT